MFRIWMQIRDILPICSFVAPILPSSFLMLFHQLLQAERIVSHVLGSRIVRATKTLCRPSGACLAVYTFPWLAPCAKLFRASGAGFWHIYMFLFPNRNYASLFRSERSASKMRAYPRLKARSESL